MRLWNVQHRHSPRGTSNCESPDPADTITDRLNTLLNSSGPDYILSLCPSQQYYITSPLFFAAPNQEISTAGYPTDSTRATLVVNGPVTNGTGQTTAVNGQCTNCDGVKLRNVQINGTRLGAPPITVDGGGNIEMGGSNANQVIEFVHSFDPRGWSCLHVDEGNLTCTNVTVQNNDIGPSGSDEFQQWADGISFACRNGVIRNNMVNNPTDGGIVLFGAPGTRVENNTVWVETNTLLGGINLVDMSPFGGDYTGVVVTNNTIAGAFASQPAVGSETLGTNAYDILIKIGIAIGPHTWFGNKYGNNVSTGGIVQDNQLTGAFSYGIAVSSVTNFTVENNVLVGNTSFIGDRGPNCTSSYILPTPTAFVADLSNVQKSTIQLDFTNFTGINAINCVEPPASGAYWPFGTNANYSGSPVSPPEAAPSPSTSSTHSTAGTTAGIVVGSIGAVLLVGVGAWYVRKWAINRSPVRYPRHSRDSYGYSRQM